MECHDDQETGKKDAGSEQADCRTIQALNDEHRGQSQQDNAHAASRIQAAHGVQAQETLFKACYLASQGVYFALLHTCTFVVRVASLCRWRWWVKPCHKSSVLRTGEPTLDDSEHSCQVTA